MYHVGHFIQEKGQAVDQTVTTATDIWPNADITPGKIIIQEAGQVVGIEPQPTEYYCR